MKKKREKFTPEEGATYRNAGGGVFKCIRIIYEGTAIMRNVMSGWTIMAHGCGLYEDGTIDWDYSTGGTFEKEET